MVARREGGEPELPGLERFPRRERLRTGSEFRAVYENGQKSLGREFVCYVVRHEGNGRKFGMAVSRKVGGAVTRNRVKRYLREIYRTCRKRLHDDVTIVIVARHKAASLSFAECDEAVGQLLQKGGVLSE